MNIRALSVFSALIFSSASHASINVEPYVGYAAGTLQPSDTSEIAVKGLMYGGRLGYRLLEFSSLAFNLGGDYVQMTGSGSKNGYSSDYTSRGFGPFAALEWANVGKIYSTLIFKSYAKIQPERKPQTFSGNGFRLGVGAGGWAGLSFLSVNFEYIARKYDSYDGSSISSAITEHSFGVTLSVPFPGYQDDLLGSLAL